MPDAPRCCDVPMTPIVYGYPSASMVEATERGEIHLGGCCVEPDLPLFRCEQCGRTSGRLGQEWDTHSKEFVGRDRRAARD